MKIFMLIKKLRYSGAYKMFLWVAKSLAEKGHDVTIFTYMKNDITELSYNIRWIQVDLENASLFRKVTETKQWMKKTGADISISFLLDANIINTLACVGTKTKSIICERNDPFKPHYYKLKLTKPLFRLADGAVFQLPKVSEYYSMVKGPTAVIPNPVVAKTEKFELLPIEQRKNVIVSLGRLDIFQKRQDILIKAFAKFLKGHPDYRLELYGDGPDEGKLKELVVMLGLSDSVIFGGITNHSLQILNKAKFFVLSSDFEGIPNALLEAMSIGLPCISTKCRPGGAEYLIQDGVNGLLIEAGNVDALCQSMNKIADTGIGDIIGNNAKTISNRFSEERIADMWCEYIKNFQKNNLCRN
ncbi:MAG: glycosyltransferase [Bacteroidaceae bacterium]|nr:glycosyltransferase [Bacteroidaceae bacterium]